MINLDDQNDENIIYFNYDHQLIIKSTDYNIKYNIYIQNKKVFETNNWILLKQQINTNSFNDKYEKNVFYKNLYIDNNNLIIKY